MLSCKYNYSQRAIFFILYYFLFSFLLPHIFLPSRLPKPKCSSENTSLRREPTTLKSFRTGCLCSRAKSHHKTLKKQKYVQKFLLFFFSLFNFSATTTTGIQRKPLNIQAFSFLLHDFKSFSSNTHGTFVAFRLWNQT